jgi:GH15 family glucan-1,4-alpha-glucosidase
MGMALDLEDYALIGDAHGAGLVGRDGSIDWLCLPRFDSPACFAALLDDPSAGRWLLGAVGADHCSRWRYRGDSLVLETEWHTSGGHARVVDFMPPKEAASDVVRIVEGIGGRVEMHTELTVRFGDGRIRPWARRLPDGRRCFIAGPDALYLDTPVDLEGVDMTTRGRFTVGAGQRVPFVLTWNPSHLPPPDAVAADRADSDTEAWWAHWMQGCTYDGPYDDAVRRSLVVLKALTYKPTGGIVAAVTTSLPEQLGGSRNWDYRYCWLRDATITLLALLEGGFHSEAAAWRRWLLRAVAGDPADLQIMYGVAGERSLPERTVPWLAGYQGASPVRIGNAAVDQLQLDVYGEVLDALHHARLARLPARPDSGPGMDAGPHHDSRQHSHASKDDPSWPLQLALMEFLESAWSRPDSGLWEIRGPERHFTYSKLMAWVAVDRAIKGAQQFGLNGPLEQWMALRTRIRDDVLTHGFDAEKNTFTQAYDRPYLDAAVLNIPLVGFLPPDDPRVAGTVDAVVRELSTEDGLLRRYDPAASDDGLSGTEGAFLACTFWLAQCQAMIGRRAEAITTFERLLDLRTDLGLLSEEYDAAAGRLVGNFPQAFSHVPLITTAAALGRAAARRAVS